MQTFTREHMENTRKEAARHRVAAREANEQIAEMSQRYEAFDQFEPADRDTWVGLMNGWAQNPEKAASDFREIANNVLGDPTATPQEKVEATQMLEKTESLTAESVKTMMSETLDARDATAKQDAAVEAVHIEIAAAGFEKGTADNFKVLWIANNDPDVKGDVGAAIEKVKAEKQQIIDDYVSGVRAGGNPTPAPGEGFAGDTAPEPITNMEEAGKAAREFLKNRPRPT